MRRRAVWVLGLLLGCASPRSAPPTEPIDATDATEDAVSATDVADTDLDAQLERRRQQHAERLEHGEPEERLRAQLELAEVYVQQAHRSATGRFELAEQRAAASTPAERAHFDRLDARLAEEHTSLLERAAAAYTRVLSSSHPAAGALRAEARFGLADVRAQQQRWDDAVEAWMALVRDDPDHALVGPTLVRLGDHAFGRQDMDKAEALYEQATQRGPSNIEGYALYKLGWIAYNRLDGAQALDRWVRVMRVTQADPTQRQLYREAARDCVRAYVLAGRPSRAQVFFERLDAQLAPSLLQQLAQHYRDDGQLENAEVVERALAQRPAAAP